MKKLLSLFAALLFVGSMFAAEITITPANCGWTSTAGEQSGTYSGISLAVANGLASSGQDPDQIRIYKDQTLTISSTAGNITKVVFNCTASGTTKYGPGCFTEVTPGAYSYDAEVGTWTGSATSIQFLAGGAQVRATSIVVTTDGEGGGSEGGEGGEGGSSEEGLITGLPYADAYYYNYEGISYWDFDIYKDYDYETEELVYPELYISVMAENKTKICGTYTLDYAGYWTSASDSVEIDYISETEAILTITFDGTNYTFVGSFPGDDGKIYKINCVTDLIAYDSDNDYAEITLEDEISQGVEDVNATKNAVKKLENGILLIEKNNIRYNVMGQKVQ